jgi:hypothetical protein
VNLVDVLLLTSDNASSEVELVVINQEDVVLVVRLDVLDN